VLALAIDSDRHLSESSMPCFGLARSISDVATYIYLLAGNRADGYGPATALCATVVVAIPQRCV